MRQTTRLRKLIEGDEVILAPGVYDGLSARLVEAAGFDVMYASGGAIARSTGIPDLGLLSLSEIGARLEQIVDAADIPVIADADTGYGNALNCQRAVRIFERAGVAALHLEDQTFPKRCGHYADKSIVPMQEFCQKLRAARDALHDKDFTIIARTDAIAVEGLQGAIDRAHAYREAGADVIFVEAPTDEAQIERIAAELPYPLLINMFWGGKTPIVPLPKLAELGYRIVIVPGDLQRAAITAMQKTAALIKRDGNTAAMEGEMASFTDREAVVNTADYLARDKRYSS